MSDREQDEQLKKIAYSSGTQSRYIDASGKEFSAQEIVSGYKPKKPYKLYSLSDQVSGKDFGKVKRSE
jgi:hypothetical protein